MVVRRDHGGVAAAGLRSAVHDVHFQPLKDQISSFTPGPVATSSLLNQLLIMFLPLLPFPGNDEETHFKVQCLVFVTAGTWRP